MPESRVAVCTWSLGPSDLNELLDRLEDVGIGAVQLALSPIVNEPSSWGGRAERAIQRIRDNGYAIVSGMMAMHGEDYSTLASIARTGGVRPDSTWRANLEHAERVADAAVEGGIGLVTFHAGFIPEDRGDLERSTLLGRLRHLADLFRERGLRLGLETGQETAETLEAALDELDRANVGVNFDPANMILYGKGEPVAALRKLAPRVCQVHVKDAVPTRVEGEWGFEVPGGDGVVDWTAFFEVACAIEPPVDFVIEREAGVERIADIRRARDLVRRHVGGGASPP